MPVSENQYSRMSDKQVADILDSLFNGGVSHNLTREQTLELVASIKDRLCCNWRGDAPMQDREFIRERFQHPGYRLDESVSSNYQFHVNPVVNQPYGGGQPPAEHLRRFLINQGQINVLITPLIVEKVMNAPAIRDAQVFAAMLYSMDIFIEINNKGEVDISFRGRTMPAFMGGMFNQPGMNPGMNGGFSGYNPAGAFNESYARNRMPILDFRIDSKGLDSEEGILQHVLTGLKERYAETNPLLKWPSGAGTPESIVDRIKVCVGSKCEPMATTDDDIELWLKKALEESTLFVWVYDEEGSVQVGSVLRGANNAPGNGPTW